MDQLKQAKAPDNSAAAPVAEGANGAPEEETAISDPKEKMKADIALLKDLFPALTAEEIPDEVWEDVKNGQSLAASYALYFLKTVKEQERIEKLNAENEKKASPRVNNDPAEENYYSYETVKNMSPAEVRKHYAEILDSMDSWN